MGADAPPDDEFDLIARLFAPLAGTPAARGLLDDAAFIHPSTDRLVISKDILVEGVHYLPEDPPETVGRKALRANLSDLAGKGARPLGYLLGCVFRRELPANWREAFARGLGADQAEFGVALWGGDTVFADGPTVISITVLGEAIGAIPPARAGARSGEDLWVTGTIGDGGLGLKSLQGRADLPPAHAALVADRYRVPRPRTTFAAAIANWASASADVSDGLLADARNIARASRVRLEIDLGVVPVSAAGKSWIAAQPNSAEALLELASAGDDYEILFTAPDAARADLIAAAETASIPLTRIGFVDEGEGDVVARDPDGRAPMVTRYGFRHSASRRSPEAD